MSKKILVVDDEPDVLMVVKIFLERAGYIVDTRDNGTFIKEINDSLPPDLYILDRNLKGEDGLTLCFSLKNHPKTKHVPVVMLSADPFIKNLYKMAGADWYIEKPFDSKNLLTVVENYVG